MAPSSRVPSAGPWPNPKSEIRNGMARPLRIDLISAELPPQLDGIGDYTFCLAAELARQSTAGSIRIWCGADRETSEIPGVQVQNAFRSMQPSTMTCLERQISKDPPDWTVLQYNPFSYGRWGLNLHLPAALKRLRHRSPGTRQALMIHEPFVPVINARFAVMTCWQRLQLWQLGRNADLVFCSIQPWVRRFHPWFPKQGPHHLPVGSAIPRIDANPAAQRQKLGIDANALVLGVFGTAHAGRLLKWVAEAVGALQSQGVPVRLLYVGPDAERIRRFVPPSLLIAPGVLPPADVSACLSTMDLYLAPFIDGVSTRRTSVMAALQHGIPMVSTVGPLTDPVFQAADGESIRLSPVADPSHFIRTTLDLAQNAQERRRMGEAGQKLFTQHFSWEVIAQSLLRHLAAKGPRS